MKSRIFFLLALLLSLALAPGLALAARPEVNYISPAALKAMMDTGDVTVIDTSQGWWTYDKKIPGSLVYPEDASSWAPLLSKDQKIVLYCG